MIAPLLGSQPPISTALAEWMSSLVGIDAAWPMHALAMLLVATAAVLAVITPLGLAGVYIERKLAGRMQNRSGPNRVGPWGLLQPIADGIKLIV